MHDVSGKECRDWVDRRPGCLRVADARYTMDFSSIGQPPIYWCEYCGAEAQAMDSALTEAFATRGPEFKEKFEGAVEDASWPRKVDKLL